LAVCADVAQDLGGLPVVVAEAGQRPSDAGVEDAL
jgi:hypothetical protein